MASTQYLNFEGMDGLMERMNFVAKPRKKLHDGKMSFQVLGIWAGVLFAGIILFFHVWWPIQAERASNELKKLESDLFIKKSELDRLRSQYFAMISLASLEHVAKVNGQWVNSSIDHVITISK